MHEFAWLIPLLPLLAAATIGLGILAGQKPSDAGEKLTSRIAVGAAALSLLLVLVIDAFALVQGAPGQVDFGHWLDSGDYHIKLSFRLVALRPKLAGCAARSGLQSGRP